MLKSQIQVYINLGFIIIPSEILSFNNKVKSYFNNYLFSFNVINKTINNILGDTQSFNNTLYDFNEYFIAQLEAIKRIQNLFIYFNNKSVSNYKNLIIVSQLDRFYNTFQEQIKNNKFIFPSFSYIQLVFILTSSFFLIIMLVIAYIKYRLIN